MPEMIEIAKADPRFDAVYWCTAAVLDEKFAVSSGRPYLSRVHVVDGNKMYGVDGHRIHRVSFDTEAGEMLEVGAYRIVKRTKSVVILVEMPEDLKPLPWEQIEAYFSDTKPEDALEFQSGSRSFARSTAYTELVRRYGVEEKWSLQLPYFDDAMAAPGPCSAWLSVAGSGAWRFRFGNGRFEAAVMPYRM